MEAARRAFAQLDTDGSGALQGDEISAAFASNLSAFEVDAALHQALLEASGGEAAGEAAPGVAAGEVAFDGRPSRGTLRCAVAAAALRLCCLARLGLLCSTPPAKSSPCRRVPQNRL